VIRLERYSLSQVQKEYPEIYKTVFGEWTLNGNVPSLIYIGYEDDKYGGFLAGYIHNYDTFYLQRTGFIIEEQGKVTNKLRAKTAINILHQEWNYILSLIRNDDIKPLKMALSIGFKIIGVRIDTQHNTWVELIHCKQEVN